MIAKLQLSALSCILPPFGQLPLISTCYHHQSEGLVIGEDHSFPLPPFIPAAHPSLSKTLAEHHEDPANMNRRMQLILGYKYYFKAMVEDEAGSGIKAALLNSELKLDIPADFLISNTYTLHAGGDLIPYTAITPDTCKHLWNHVGDFFFGADLVVAIWRVRPISPNLIQQHQK